MLNPEWRDRLRKELRKRNLPASYTARLIEELTDHFTDIQKENLSMDALATAEQKVGTPESLAEAAKNEYRKRTFAGRHPFVVFALLPIPATAIASLVVIYSTFAIQASISPTFPSKADSPSSFEWIAAYCCLYIARFLPFVLISSLFARMAWRVCCPGWRLIACGIVACFAFMFQFDISPPSVHHNLVIGLAFGPPRGYGFFQWLVIELHKSQWNGRFVQVAIPFVIGAIGVLVQIHSFGSNIVGSVFSSKSFHPNGK